MRKMTKTKDLYMRESSRTIVPIFKMAKANAEFREALMTGENRASHKGHDQVLMFVEGSGEAASPEMARAQ